MIDQSFQHNLIKYLESFFYLGFEVEIKSAESVLIRFNDSELQLFNLEVKIKADVRLTILLNPEKYSANFVNHLSSSTLEQREKFNSIWDSIGTKLISVTINNEIINPEAFLQNNKKWNSFSIKFTKAPICNNEDSNSIDAVVFKNISDIITMALSLVDFEIEGHSEGKLSRIEVNKYERNPVNRRICLMSKGYICHVCGFDFEKTYGNIGKEYIEVHHITQVSEMGENYIVKPLEDLVPLCSNCHSMIHSSKPMLSIDHLKSEFLKNTNK